MSAFSVNNTVPVSSIPPNSVSTRSPTVVCTLHMWDPSKKLISFVSLGTSEGCRRCISERSRSTHKFDPSTYIEDFANSPPGDIATAVVWLWETVYNVVPGDVKMPVPSEARPVVWVRMTVNRGRDQPISVRILETVQQMNTHKSRKRGSGFLRASYSEGRLLWDLTELRQISNNTEIIPKVATKLLTIIEEDEAIPKQAGGSVAWGQRVFNKDSHRVDHGRFRIQKMEVQRDKVEGEGLRVSFVLRWSEEDPSDYISASNLPTQATTEQ